MPAERTGPWTIRELMRSAIDHFQRSGFDEARLNVELLLAYALDLPRIHLYLHFDKPLSPEEVARFRSLYERRLKHEPVQYIIGAAGFMGLQFAVDRRVLIPRPETETLIEEVIVLSRKYPQDQPLDILEIGTGSGNVAVSIAKFVKSARIVTVEKSREAMEVAAENIRRHAVEEAVRLVHGDIFERVPEMFGKKFDIVVSNPPYIPAEEMNGLQEEVREFEPSCALTDGFDGLRFFQFASETGKSILKPGGSLAVEIGFGQADRVRQILQDQAWTDVRAVNDLLGIPRVMTGTRPAEPQNNLNLN